MIDENRIKRFIEGAKEAFREVDNKRFNFPMTILSAYKLATSIEELMKEQEARILSLEEAIEGKNGLEIDPYVFVEIKGREDIFIGAVSDVSHYNYPNLTFDVGECFQVNRSFPASKNYLNTDYMKTVRCWTHKPSKEQRQAVKWE